MKYLITLLFACIAFAGISQYTLDVTTSSDPETDMVYIFTNNTLQTTIQLKDSLPNTQYSYLFAPSPTSTTILHTTSNGFIEATDDMGGFVDLCPYDSFSNAINTTTPYEIVLSAQFGCTYSIALNYDPNATVDDGCCVFDCVTGVDGCMYENAANYDPNASYDSGGNCDFAVNLGCTYSNAFNYDPAAVQDNGTCDFGIGGCTYTEADNYDSTATVDDGSCTGFAEANDCPTDLDGNGETNTSDLLGFLGAFGTNCADLIGDGVFLSPQIIDERAMIIDLQGNIITRDVSKLGSIGSGTYIVVQGKNAIFIQQ